MRKARLWPLILLSMLPGCTLFAGGKPIVATRPVPCTSLLPQEWKKGVDGAPLPASAAAGEWLGFADAQTGRLEQANGRYVDGIGIVERCEARDATAVKQASRGLIGRLFH